MMNGETLNQEKINEWRWQIVQNRDANFNGAFLTAVLTTGIFCKPACPAKTPKRENITFYASCDEAERAGFRACLRCRPKENNMTNSNAELVLRACKFIESNNGEAISLESLSAKLSLSASHLQRIFKNILGVSPKEFADAKRIENFKRQAKNADVTTAMYDAGFNSSRALYEKAVEKLGMTPAVYRKGGKNMKINFTVVDSRLGKMLVAATEKGVCAVTFGDDGATLETILKTEFPAAEILPDEHNLKNHVNEILQHIEGGRKQIDLPLDLQATAFQMRVWAELRKIPYGETRSYKQVAAAIEQPTAVRAVARACATNPVALVNPCHRVVGSDGKLTGYRWGVERKQQILEREQG